MMNFYTAEVRVEKGISTEVIIGISCAGILLLIIIAVTLFKLKQARNKIVFAQGLAPDPNFQVMKIGGG